jgi:hypothetical protein
VAQGAGGRGGKRMAGWLLSRESRAHLEAGGWERQAPSIGGSPSYIIGVFGTLRHFGLESARIDRGGGGGGAGPRRLRPSATRTAGDRRRDPEPSSPSSAGHRCTGSTARVCFCSGKEARRRRGRTCCIRAQALHRG